MKKWILFLSILSLASITACGGKGAKKHSFRFSGSENAEQAFNKCVQLSTKKKFQDSIDCLEIFKSRFPESPLAQEAELKIGDAYFKKKEYLLAAETYLLYPKLYPTGEKADYAYYRTGLSYLNQSPKKIDRDQEYLPSSIDYFSIVTSQYPNSQYYKISQYKLDEARRRIAKRNMYVAKFYYKFGEYKASIPRFEEVYQKFSNLGLDEEALYYTIRAYKELGKMDEAKATYEILKGKYPNSKRLKKLPKEVLVS